MERVLHVVNSMGVGGIETFLMNVYRSINKDEFQFDFLLHKKTNSYYEDEIKALGGGLYYLPSRRDGLIKSKSALDAFFDAHREYHIVHDHVSSLSDIDALIYARKYEIEGRIIHAHSTAAPGNKIHKFLHRINQSKVKSVANYYFSCSDAATEWLYSGTGIKDKVSFIPNGVDCQAFCFDNYIRKDYREKLNINNKKTIIHIGRMSSEKNQLFLIDAFKIYHDKNNNSKLLLVGDGIMRNEIKDKIHKLNLDEDVELLGVRKDVSALLMAADLFVLPSVFEGFPVSIVEAQATGIPCLYSKNVTSTAKVLQNVHQLEIDKGPKIWADKFEVMLEEGRQEDANQKISASAFNIENVSDNLSAFYKKILRIDT